MNARQKAKRFKKLYEETLPKKPYPVKYMTTLPRHYRIQALMDLEDVVCSQDHPQDHPQLTKTLIENRVLQKIRPLIWDNIITEYDIKLNKYRCILDIWMGVEDA